MRTFRWVPWVGALAALGVAASCGTPQGTSGTAPTGQAPAGPPENPGTGLPAVLSPEQVEAEAWVLDETSGAPVFSLQQTRGGGKRGGNRRSGGSSGASGGGGASKWTAPAKAVWTPGPKWTPPAQAAWTPGPKWTPPAQAAWTPGPKGTPTPQAAWTPGPKWAPPAKVAWTPGPKWTPPAKVAWTPGPQWTPGSRSNQRPSGGSSWQASGSSSDGSDGGASRRSGNGDGNWSEGDRSERHRHGRRSHGGDDYATNNYDIVYYPYGSYSYPYAYYDGSYYPYYGYDYPFYYNYDGGSYPLYYGSQVYGGNYPGIAGGYMGGAAGSMPFGYVNAPPALNNEQPVPSGLIQLTDLQPAPTNLNVLAGGIVVWVNNTGLVLNIKPLTAPGFLESGPIAPGQSSRPITFGAPGVYAYVAEGNPLLRGTITVR